MKHLFGGVQWAVFLMASSIATPIAIAAVLGMDSTETTLFIQRTIFILGIACIIQALIGHRMPINEGPAGLWWGIFTIYAGLVGVMYPSMESTFQALQSGLMYSGIIFIVFALTGIITKMKALFTPTVTFAYLMLLVLQLSGTFIKGMFGIKSNGDPMDGTILIGSLLVLIVTLFFMNNKVSWISRYSIVLSIGVGWLIFILLGKGRPITFDHSQIITLPKMLVFGPPVWDSGMFVTAFFLTLLLIANMMASIRVMESLFKQSFSIEKKTREKEGSIASGINQLLSGLFSAIGPVPISAAAGFVSATRLTSLVPFIIGGVVVIIVSLFPVLMGILSALPPPVAYAVTFSIFTKMFELAFNELAAEKDKQQAFRVAAFGVMIGTGIMFVPPESLSGLPNILVALLSNGLITGTLIAISLEQLFIFNKKNRSKKNPNQANET